MGQVIQLTSQFIENYCTADGGRMVCYVSGPFQLCPIQYGNDYYTSVAISVNPAIPPQLRLLLAEMKKVDIEDLPR
jgi:hypothetical protein